VAVIRNETNLGFPKGCNQGPAEARGDYLVLLNNDTVVTEGWAEGLVRLLLFDPPHTGMVGPVTNGAPPPQYVEAFRVQQPAFSGQRSAISVAEVDSFAAKRRRDFKGQALNAERITGFCLAIRRDVLEAVGGKLDEGYGLGYFEDDDLCVRVRNAGFRPAVALDVFIYHFGTLTYAGLGIDSRKLMLEGFERFKEKWGEERAKGYRLPRGDSEQEGTEGTEKEHVAVSEAACATGARVTIAIIAKNEEANLGDCLESVKGLGAEIIVVDTGSTDRTREIALEYGAKVFDFPWVDSFAAARNECLRHATGEWIFWMDADDRLDADNREKLRALFAALGDENVAHVMKCLCLKKTPEGVTPTGTEIDHVRLFRHYPACAGSTGYTIRFCRRSSSGASGCAGATWSFITSVIKTRQCVARSSNATCGCCSSTWWSIRTIRLSSSISARSTRSRDGWPRRLRL